MKKYAWISLLVVLSLALASCGGGGGGASKDIRVTMTDFKFAPDKFTVPAGQQISLSATNNGAITHDFIIMKLGTQVGDHYSSANEPEVYWKIEVPAGQSVKETFTAPADLGEYQVLCGIPGHYEAGMVAKLVVVAQ